MITKFCRWWLRDDLYWTFMSGWFHGHDWAYGKNNLPISKDDKEFDHCLLSMDNCWKECWKEWMSIEPVSPLKQEGNSCDSEEQR